MYKGELELWSNCYGRWLMFKRLWVRTSAMYTGWTFFTLICCKNCIVCLIRPKINEKEAGLAHFFKKQWARHHNGICHFQALANRKRSEHNYLRQLRVRRPKIRTLLVLQKHCRVYDAAKWALDRLSVETVDAARWETHAQTFTSLRYIRSLATHWCLLFYSLDPLPTLKILVS